MEGINGLKYERSLVRHGYEVPIEGINGLEKGVVTLLKIETGSEMVDFERISTYTKKVLEHLDKNALNYLLTLGINEERKCGLTIEKVI